MSDDSRKKPKSESSPSEPPEERLDDLVAAEIDADPELAAALADASDAGIADVEDPPPEDTADDPADDAPADAPPDDDAAHLELDDVDMRDLVRGALRPPKGAVAPSLLRGVQRRLRVRSRGKFYGDGWSTARAPRSTYLITSLIMLALMLLAFLILVPWSAGSV